MKSPRLHTAPLRLLLAAKVFSMANPQKEEGFLPVANEIAEALMKINLSAYESRVLWFLFRKTYGWGKKTDWISLSQFSECIGLDRRLIHRAIKGLSSKKMIVIEKDDGIRIRYGFQKDYEKWKVSSKKMTVIKRDDEVSSKKMTRLSSKEIPTIDTITKDTITKEISTPKKLFLECIRLTDEQEGKLKERFNGDFDKAIELLNNFKMSSGKKYKSDYHTLIGWVAKEIEKNKNITMGGIKI